MEYRQIGSTGMSASIIGLGGEHLDGKPYSVVEETVHAALNEGVNIIDVFMPGEEIRTNIGKAIKQRRADVMIQGHIGSVDLNQQYDISRKPDVAKKYFEAMLRNMDTDYIDFGMLFFMDGQQAFDDVFNGGIAQYAQKLKQAGSIRAIGASSHDPITAAKVVETGIVDLLMFSINPAFDMTPQGVDVLGTFDDDYAKRELSEIDSAREHLYRLCESRGVAITVMKTLGAGRLLNAAQSPFGIALTPAQCIHYALTRPAVVSALIGCESAQQVKEAVSYLELPDSEKDYAAVIGAARPKAVTGCVYCNHCLPCPKEIDIASVTRYADIASVSETGAPPPSALAHYTALAHHASECINCGKCASKCPFGINAPENMRRAASIFGV